MSGRPFSPAVRVLGGLLTVAGALGAVVMGWITLFIAAAACETDDGTCDNGDVIPAVAIIVAALAIAVLGLYLLIGRRRG